MINENLTSLKFEKYIHHILNYEWSKKGTTLRLEIFDKEYKKESEVKDNKNMERKTNFISKNQNERIDFKPDLVSVVEKTVTGHTRAGIKTDSKTDWESNEPIFRGVTNNRAMIDYRTSKGNFYKKGQKIKDTDMIIESFSKDSVLIKYPTGIRVFYVESYQELKK